MTAQTLSKLRYHIFVCADSGEFCGCEANGGLGLVGALRRGLVRHRLMPYVKVTLMNCNQPKASGPLAVVYPEGIWYDGLTDEDVDAFIATQLIEGRPFESRLMRSAPVSGYSAY